MNERHIMPSGAEVFTWPTQYPELRDTDEAFYAFPDCGECRGGRTTDVDKAGTYYFVQCIYCWSRHFDHPETQRVHKEQLAALNERAHEIDYYFQPKGTL